MFMGFSQRLNQAMVEAKVIQEPLADKVGVSQQTISNWLGGTVPKKKHLERAAKALRVTPEWLEYGDKFEWQPPGLATTTPQPDKHITELIFEIAHRLKARGKYDYWDLDAGKQSLVFLKTYADLIAICDEKNIKPAEKEKVLTEFDDKNLERLLATIL